jgi:hypothetical protein
LTQLQLQEVWAGQLLQRVWEAAAHKLCQVLAVLIQPLKGMNYVLRWWLTEATKPQLHAVYCCHCSGMQALAHKAAAAQPVFVGYKPHHELEDLIWQRY